MLCYAPLPLFYNKVELRAAAAARKKHPASTTPLPVFCKLVELRAAAAAAVF
jgi:hypothetical protein